MCRNDSEIFRLKGIDLFKVEEVGDSLEDGEAPIDTTDNDDKLKCSETNNGNYRASLD